MDKKLACIPFFRLPNGRKVYFKTLRPRSRRTTPQTVPTTLAGQYVAWTANGFKIVGHGSTIAEARANAGNKDSLLIQKIPRASELRPTIPASSLTDPV